MTDSESVKSKISDCLETLEHILLLVITLCVVSIEFSLLVFLALTDAPYDFSSLMFQFCFYSIPLEE